ncbi:hypothetical protein NE237_022923 [Protea cynaroides]|uniref:Uncharacterized protein n=1 Tax=Protea cynaroides TaxID=273540 RepID=A0A9Q0HBX0_9MAGN|nr:hypothetical protein NE237_022923 [Protea cynaroides]
MDFSAMEEEAKGKSERSFGEEDEKKARSFRYEDYNNRRVFLRSYPLHWTDDEVDDDYDVMATQGMLDDSKRGKITAIKRRALIVLRWSEGKVLILKKLKNKVCFYLVTCCPFRLKQPSPSLLSIFKCSK